MQAIHISSPLTSALRYRITRGTHHRLTWILCLHVTSTSSTKLCHTQVTSTSFTTLCHTHMLCVITLCGTQQMIKPVRLTQIMNESLRLPTGCYCDGAAADM
ncbi:hypothetical protein VPH35_126885 [Triticum aestivum]